MSGTRSDNRPGSFAKTHACPTPCTLRHPSVYHNKTNRLFAEIICWTDTISLQKQEVAFIDTINKSVFDIYCFAVIRRAVNFL